MIWWGSALDLFSQGLYSLASSGSAAFARCYCCLYCLNLSWHLHSSCFETCILRRICIIRGLISTELNFHYCITNDLAVDIWGDLGCLSVIPRAFLGYCHDCSLAFRSLASDTCWYSWPSQMLIVSQFSSLFQTNIPCSTLVKQEEDYLA
jgi:hypothetical protein